MKYLLVINAVLLSFICCTPDQTSKAKVKDVYPVKEVVMDNLKRPWSMAFLSEEEALVAEKDGDLLRVNLNTKRKISIDGFPSDLADSLTLYNSEYRIGTYPTGVPEGIRIKYNAGIFDVVLDPLFQQNSKLYVSYVSETDEGYATKIISARLVDNSLTEIKELLLATPYIQGLFHFGGGMIFGTDGKLYITMGERLFSEAHEPEIPIAQDLSDRRGKVYRINPDGSIPEDNPDFGSSAIPGFYAVGIRAAQGLALDPVTGNIWMSEHGTIQGDELNVLQSGANFGWPIRTTGKYRGPGYEPPSMKNTEFTEPAWAWLHTVAPTGLSFYSGDEFPTWKNDLLVPGLSRGSLWRVRIDGTTIKSMEELFVDDRVRTRKVAVSPEGKIYLLTDEQNGRIIRVKNGSIE